MIERTPQSPPRIAPLDASAQRPLWSVMIPAYNCTRYLTETIESVLANTAHLSNMQIEVVDDRSTDADVAALVQEAGGGRVSFFQQPENVGSLRNFETCINRAQGQWIHLLHGDDKIAPGFYDEIQALFMAHPEAGSACTNVAFIDESGQTFKVNDDLLESPGVLSNWLERIATENLLQPPAVVVKRSVYETLGSFFAVHYGEDWEMWVRIAAHYPVAYSPKVLALYRYLRQDSISNASLRSGAFIRDMLKVMEIIQDYLPPADRAHLKAAARAHYSKYAASSAHGIYDASGDYQAALNQGRRAVHMHANSTTITSLTRLYLKIALDKLGLRPSQGR